jgi:hypothetical protein
MRGYAFAGGKADDPAAISIATKMTNFVFDSMADSIANQNGFPMAPGFEKYYRSSSILDTVKHPVDCRHFGTNWERIWKYLEETRHCRVLQIKLPNIPREYRTMMDALSFANILKRAHNLDLKIGLEIKNALSKQRILSKVVDDLMDIDAKNKTNDIDSCISELNNLFEYFQLQPGQIQITKPLTGENLVDDHWQTTPKDEVSGILKKNLKSTKTQ